MEPRRVAVAFDELALYANEGAQLEMMKKLYPEEWSSQASAFDRDRAARLFPNELGYFLVYIVDRDVDLQFLPKANVSINERVVAIPAEAKLWGVIPALEWNAFNFDLTTGRPTYDSLPKIQDRNSIRWDLPDQSNLYYHWPPLCVQLATAASEKLMLEHRRVAAP